MRALVIAFTLALPMAAQVGGRAQRPKIERPDGPVWQVVRQHCTNCHGIDDYAFFSLDKAGWAKLIGDKHRSAITMPDADRELLLGWLSARFGPATKPFPRSYVPKEITTFFSDPEAFRLMNRACVRCHPIDKVQGVRKATEAWRVTLVDMRERGAQLSDEELERLVEWLDRVWGTNQDK
jgi:mono/diheme cytochrome c family protein